MEIEEKAKEQLAEDVAISEDGENSGEVIASYSPVWQQLIEHSSWGNRSWRQASNWSTGAYPCDSKPDIDYMFYFANYNSSNPDAIRWTTSSTQVQLAFLADGSLSENGFAWNWNSANLCAGNTTVAVAGGANYVRSRLFLTKP